MRPTLFIGSSSEGLDYAQAARRRLSAAAEVTVWDEAEADSGLTIIEWLMQEVERFDFALLILTADDWLSSKDVKTLSPRDNVIFELGLFMASLGRSRTFLLAQAAPDVKLPSDLKGVLPLFFEPPNDANYTAAVGGPCDLIRNRVSELGLSDRKISREFDQLTSRQDLQDKELSRQKTQIESLQVALQGIVTGYELDKLTGLSQPRFAVRYSNELIRELRHLREMGFVLNYDGTGLRTMTDRYKNSPEQFDLREHFHITDEGIKYLRVRRELDDVAASPESPLPGLDDNDRPG